MSLPSGGDACGQKRRRGSRQGIEYHFCSPCQRYNPTNHPAINRHSDHQHGDKSGKPTVAVQLWQQAQQARSGETLMFNVDLFTSDGQLLTSDGFTLDEAASRLDGQATMRLRFAAPGRYTVQGELAYALTGSDPWWSQTASRDCQDTPTGWACSPWNSRLDGGETPFEAVGSLGNTALGQAITVLAVPEPGSRTLYTAAATGLLLVVISRQRRRRPAPAR